MADHATRVESKSEIASSDTLLDTALSNLDAARQFIDEGMFPFEGKLVSFHYGFALLTKFRDDQTQLSIAKRYLAEAADWKENAAETQRKLLEQANAESGQANLRIPTVDQIAGAIKRIRIEALHNLAVAHHLSHEYGTAAKFYGEVVLASGLYSSSSNHATNRFTGVGIAAEFGWILASVDGTWLKGREEFAESRSRDSWVKGGAHIQSRIQKFKKLLQNLQKEKPEVTPGPVTKYEIPQSESNTYRTGFLSTLFSIVGYKLEKLPTTPPTTQRISAESLNPRRLTTDHVMIEEMVRKLEQIEKMCFPPTGPDSGADQTLMAVGSTA